MKYMLLAYSDERAWDESEREQCYKDSGQIVHDLRTAGRNAVAAPLHPVATATSVRVRDGKPLITDGPFAETREQLGGYFLLDVTDLDEAIAIAGRLPSAKLGTIEIRPILEVRGVPDGLSKS
ncbi:MAG TPA: YciI family protein [bacterium]|nr:YciI family protein [bacterium]